MAPIPEVMQLLEKIKSIHEKKNEDYAAKGASFENFERSAVLSSWFNSDYDKSFVVLIGTKLARLATLLNKVEAPNNESIEDSFLDLSTYCILWSAYHSKPRDNQVTWLGPGDYHLTANIHNKWIREHPRKVYCQCSDCKLSRANDREEL